MMIRMTVKMTIWMNVAECVYGVTMMMIVMLIRYQSVAGGRSRGRQHPGLRTKALMRGLGTRLGCRQRSFVRTEKNIAEIYFWGKFI